MSRAVFHLDFVLGLRESYRQWNIFDFDFVHYRDFFWESVYADVRVCLCASRDINARIAFRNSSQRRHLAFNRAVNVKGLGLYFVSDDIILIFDVNVCFGLEILNPCAGVDFVMVIFGRI